MSFEVKIYRSSVCDETIREILESVVFQNDSGNKMVSYNIDDDPLVLTYEKFA